MDLSGIMRRTIFAGLQRSIRVCAPSALILLALAVHADGDAASDWQQIVAMDTATPASDQWKTRADAEAGALEYLGKQEQTLRDFISSYPGDAHAPDAKLRLAHLLATRGDLKQDSQDRHDSEAILGQLERDPAMKDRLADVAFARISIFMQRVNAATGENRDTLLDQARAFAKQFPDDRRVAPLLAEVATAFDDQPRTARDLLEQARPAAKTPELQSRIADDLKRLALLGKPLQMQWTAVDGTRIDLDTLRGKVVVIYFFASWSSPSMYELDWVRQLAGRIDPESTQFLGICLDNDPVAVSGLMSDHGLSWPVYCDGRGWQGHLIRSLGINALPQIWILDRDGILRTLDAKQNAELMIKQAARESGH